MEVFDLPSEPQSLLLALEPIPSVKIQKRKKRQNFSDLGDDDKKEAIKVSNRLAAQSLRDRKRKYERDLEERLKLLEESNHSLASQVNCLEDERKVIERDVQSFTECQIDKYGLQGLVVQLNSALRRETGNGEELKKFISSLGINPLQTDTPRHELPSPVPEQLQPLSELPQAPIAQSTTSDAPASPPFVDFDLSGFPFESNPFELEDVLAVPPEPIFSAQTPSSITTQSSPSLQTNSSPSAESHLGMLSSLPSPPMAPSTAVPREPAVALDEVLAEPAALSSPLPPGLHLGLLLVFMAVQCLAPLTARSTFLDSVHSATGPSSERAHHVPMASCAHLPRAGCRKWTSPPSCKLSEPLCC